MSQPTERAPRMAVQTPTAPRRFTDRLRRESVTYSHGEHRPLGSYAAIIGAYGALLAGGAIAARRSGRRPRRVGTLDVVLTAGATFQLARTLAKQPVTSPFRAPFTRYQGVSGPAELREEARGHGLRHAIGELVTCPFCLAHWIVTGFGFGFVYAPETTRLAAAMLTAEAGAGFLQFAHAAVEGRTEARED